MDTLPDKLVAYLQDTLATSVGLRPWRSPLAHFLRQTYEFRIARLLDTELLFVFDAAPEERAPTVVRKHIRQTRAVEGGADHVVYVPARLSAYHRKRLIEHKVPFVVPSNQMYLPTIGIDFREHFKRLREEPTRLSPSTQVLLLHMLLRAADQPLTPKRVAAMLGYSAMSMTRAFDELESSNLATSESRGRERQLRLAADTSDTWDAALPYLRSPVKKRQVISRNTALLTAPRAGLSALAEYTMLSVPHRPTVALSQTEWKHMRDTEDTTAIPHQDPDAMDIEIWAYPPTEFSDGGLVDRLSLYLSLRGDGDERVSISLETLLENVKW